MPTPTDRKREEVAREDASGRTLETGAGQQEAPRTSWTCERQDGDGGDINAGDDVYADIYWAIHDAKTYEFIANVHSNERDARLIASAPVTAAAARAMMEALIQARGALLLDAMHDQDGKPYGTTVVALEMIDAALSLARSSGIKGE